MVTPRFEYKDNKVIDTQTGILNITYVMENENVMDTGCFDCGKLDENDYSNYELAIPKSFRKIWGYLNVEKSLFMGYVNYPSKNIPNKFGGLVGNSWVGEIENKFEFDESGNIL